MKKTKNRYLLFDGIRGIAIINMVIFHFLYDIFIIYGRNPQWYGKIQIHLWQQFICWTFIFIAGFVWQWGKKTNLRRGIFLNLCGVFISLITWYIIPTEAIRFGILNFMGCAVLLLIPFDIKLMKIPPTVGITVSFASFLLLKNIQYGALRIGCMELMELPHFLYTTKLLTPLGFPYEGFISSDYFPIFPWIFLFLIGYFSNSIFMNHASLKYIGKQPIPLLSVIGQRSIWIYLLHQPLSMLVCIFLYS